MFGEAPRKSGRGGESRAFVILILRFHGRSEGSLFIGSPQTLVACNIDVSATRLNC